MRISNAIYNSIGIGSGMGNRIGAGFGIGTIGITGTGFGFGCGPGLNGPGTLGQGLKTIGGVLPPSLSSSQL
jgi:hypothetical protein